MLFLINVTGVTDGYGLSKLYEILINLSAAAQSTGIRILRTPGNLPNPYVAYLAGDGRGDFADGSQLLVLQHDSGAQKRVFVLTVVTSSRQFATQLGEAFTTPGVNVNLSNVVVREVD